MNNVLEKGRVTAGQDVLNKLITNLRKLGTPPLGPEFKTLRGTDLNDALVIHRLSAKFEPPTVENDTAKKRSSVQKMLDYDSGYKEARKGFFKKSGVVKHHCEAKVMLHKMLKGYKPSMKASMPKGETVISADGYVNLYYKLISDDQWSVSASCVRDAAKIAYNNLFLKRIVKQRFSCRPYPGGLDPRPSWVREAREQNKFIGFYVFERMFLSLVNIVGVSRITTVPKNNKEARVITCDPMWNLVVQRSIALGLLECVRKNTGLDITQLQDVHRKRIADPDSATIDLSKASDSNWLQMFKLLFPQRIVDAVLRARTGIAEYEGEYYLLNQLAPMGCGFTFEIMTLTLLAYARVLDAKASVFGDDIIVNRASAPRLIKTLTNVGWVINYGKTFIDGNFRESCGGFHNLSTKQDIVSHDLFFPSTIGDVIAAGNKLYNILDANQVSKYVRSLLLEAYVSLMKIIPCVAFTEIALRDGEDSEMLRVPKGFDNYHFYSKRTSEYNRDYQRMHKLGKRLTYVPDVEIRARRDDVPLVLQACYFYGGITPIGRKTGELAWISYLKF